MSDLLDELQKMWQVPAIAYLCEMLSHIPPDREWKAVPPVSVEELEEALMYCDDSVHPLLVRLHIQLLRGLWDVKRIDVGNWQAQLAKTVERFMPLCPVLRATEYRQLSMQEKVSVLHLLLEWRLCDHQELDLVQTITKDYEISSLRLQPIGEDDKGNKYWPPTQDWKKGNETTSTSHSR
eukprot:m.129185 g.129185  ORF g.129185 m.129185 type:complete len:180 (+) comp19931_c0_seq5:274-813(+)